MVMLLTVRSDELHKAITIPLRIKTLIYLKNTIDSNFSFKVLNFQTIVSNS